MSDLKKLHLRFVCGVATDAGIPPIWAEVQAASTKQSGFSLLSQYLLTGMGECRRDFLGHADLLHCSTPFYNFIAGDRFVNPGENPACPAGGMSLWTTLQGRGDIGTRIGDTNAELIALDNRNAQADLISRAAKVHLQALGGAANLQKEIGTKAYILDRIFGPTCPLVTAYKQHLIPFIDENFSAFERQVNSREQCTKFAYDLSRVEATYYNNCIRASATANTGSPGGLTSTSFQVLIDELQWGRYSGQTLPASLQSLITNTPPARQQQAAAQNQNPPAAPGAPGQRGNQQANREGAPVANDQPIQRLRLLDGESTRILRNVALPNINRTAFCKRWHMGMTCFANCPRARSHVNPTPAVVDTVAALLAVERAAA